MGPARVRRRRWRRAVLPVPALLLSAVLAAACSGGGASSSSSPGTGPEGTPVPGGRLVYGLGADADGFDPVRSSFTPQTYAMAGTIIEALTVVDAGDRWRPLLAESLTPEQNAAQWRIKIRKGITFSTGEPLTAEVVKANLDAQKASPLTAGVLAPVVGSEVLDSHTVQVHLNQPWANFPTTLSSQVGMIVPKSSLANPQQAARRPVGTGPFTFASYVPDNRFIVRKNPKYWQKGRPYLNQIEFRILPDFQTKAQTLESGGLQAMMTQRDTDIVKFGKLAEQGQYRMYQVKGMSVPELYFPLNLAKPPLDDLRARQALAHATDRQAFIKTLRSGLTKQADGPWSPDSKWYTPGGYPAFDLNRAKALVAEYEKEKGPIKFELLSVPDQSSIQNAELAQDMWAKAGIEVTIRQSEQADLVSRALTGNYNAFVSTQFYRPDPDGEYQWMHSRFIQPAGRLSLNMSRLNDKQLSDALDVGRRSSDEATRKRAYATVQQRLRAVLPYIFVDHLSTTALITKPEVKGLAKHTLPDGSQAAPLSGSLAHPFDQIWIGR